MSVAPPASSVSSRASLESGRSNRDLAAALRRAAGLLREQGANPFRVNAYRRAARTLDDLAVPATVLHARGREALEELPGIGSGIAQAIEEMLRSGRWRLLDRLDGQDDPEGLLQTIPGIGTVLARRFHEDLGIESLEALEIAAHDGRLEKVPGVGARRAAAIRALLAERLGRRAPTPPSQHRPSVEVLLEVEKQYREDADEDRLRTIAPRRFNPKGMAWLPIGHYERGGWHFTALFSNTALAHQLGRNRDWVILYYYDRDHCEGQNTAVTEHRGELTGLRVIRGREDECRRYYSETPSS